MIVRIRLGSNLARLAPAPDAQSRASRRRDDRRSLRRLASSAPELGPALASALPVVAGAHVEQGRTLSPGEEIALLTPVAGG